MFLLRVDRTVAVPFVYVQYQALLLLLHTVTTPFAVGAFTSSHSCAQGHSPTCDAEWGTILMSAFLSSVIVGSFNVRTPPRHALRSCHCMLHTTFYMTFPLGRSACCCERGFHRSVACGHTLKGWAPWSVAGDVALGSRRVWGPMGCGR